MSSIGKVPRNEDDDDLLDDSALFERDEPDQTAASTRFAGNRGRKLKPRKSKAKKSTNNRRIVGNCHFCVQPSESIENQLRRKSKMTQNFVTAAAFAPQDTRHATGGHHTRSSSGHSQARRWPHQRCGTKCIRGSHSRHSFNSRSPHARSLSKHSIHHDHHSYHTDHQKSHHYRGHLDHDNGHQSTHMGHRCQHQCHYSLGHTHRTMGSTH
jgi:hypothetical protein